MKVILTHSEQNAIEKIDELMNTYCDKCLLKTHIRKTEGKTQAHHFCISECSIGKQIKHWAMNFNRRNFMHIKSIEDTPNYNTIKINLSEKRKDNQSNTYTSAQDGQPDLLIDYLISKE